MATLEQQSELKRLQGVLSDIFTETPESFTRKELGDELNFERGLPYFQQTFDLIKELNSYSLDEVPYNTIKPIADSIYQTHHTLSQILKFSARDHKDNPFRVRDQLINNIRDGYDHLFKIITPLVTYSATKQTDLGEITQAAFKNLEEITKLKLEFEKEKATIIEQSESILETIRDTAAEEGVSQHASYFKEEAQSHEKASKN